MVIVFKSNVQILKLIYETFHKYHASYYYKLRLHLGAKGH